MILPALIGAGLAAAMIWAFWRAGMLAERSGMAILLAAIALFYPVFAAAEGDWSGFILHVAIFAVFGALALYGFGAGMYLIAGGILLHGLLDAGLIAFGAPGPVWWPAFCAGVDIVMGVILIRLVQLRKIPA